VVNDSANVSLLGGHSKSAGWRSEKLGYQQLTVCWVFVCFLRRLVSIERSDYAEAAQHKTQYCQHTYYSTLLHIYKKKHKNIRKNCKKTKTSTSNVLSLGVQYDLTDCCW